MSDNYNKQELIRDLQNMPVSLLQQKADEFARKQGLERHNDVIEHMAGKNNGNPIQFQDNWKPMFWQANGNTAKKTVTIRGKEVPVYDMDFYIAESLQSLQSGQDPEAEYYGWIDQAKTIIKDIKTDGTTLQEIHARSDFVAFLDDRETELKRVISLYAGAAFNNNCSQQNPAREKLKFLTFKLSELRKIRERVQSTKPSRPKHKKNLIKQVADDIVTEEYIDDDSLGSNDYDDLDNSAEAVSLASQLCAMHILRNNQQEQEQNNLANQPAPEMVRAPYDSAHNLSDLEKLREKMRKIWRLSGRLPQRIKKIRKGFSAQNYMALKHSSENEYVY